MQALPFLPHRGQLPVYQPGRPIEEVARELGIDASTIDKLASNENPSGPSPKAVLAVQEAARHMHLYPDGGAFALKQKLARHLGVDPTQLILGNGSNEILELVGHILLHAGAEVVASQYCFAVYPIVTHLFGARWVSVPANGFAHDLDAMANAITAQTRIVFAANPNNPTGTCAPEPDLRRFIGRIPPSTLLVMDEAYIEFLDQPADLLPRLLDTPNLLLARTFSKIHGLAGLRVGYGIAHPSLIATLEKARQPFNLNSLAQAAAMAALDDPDHVAVTRAVNRAGLRQLEAGFTRLGLEFVPSVANFILVKVGDGNAVFNALQRRGCIVRPVASYQLPEWIRVSVGTAAQNERCLAALSAVLAPTR